MRDNLDNDSQDGRFVQAQLPDGHSGARFVLVPKQRGGDKFESADNLRHFEMLTEILELNVQSYQMNPNDMNPVKNCRSLGSAGAAACCEKGFTAGFAV